jgi:hypothetical protein
LSSEPSSFVLPLHLTFFEAHFPLTGWISGIKLLQESFPVFQSRFATFAQLFHWMQQGRIIPKPTLSTARTFTFWFPATLWGSVMALPGIYGGSPVNLSPSWPHTLPRPKRVLLDIGVDNPSLITQLKQAGLEIVWAWDYLNDLIQYELIEVCSAQYIDLIVTTNERLLTSSEDWLSYLLPHRTRLFIIPPEAVLQNPHTLAEAIVTRAQTKRAYRTPNKPFYLKSPNKDAKEEGDIHNGGPN